MLEIRQAKPDFRLRGPASVKQLISALDAPPVGLRAACRYLPGKPAANNDASFRGWTCAEGLACQVAGKTSRMGMCFVKSR